MNMHYAPPPAPQDIHLVELEDTVNTALNAALMASDFFEGFMHRILGVGSEDANTAIYTVNLLVDAVRASHDHFHEFMQQEFAKRKADVAAGRVPDPVQCPSFVGDGLYRFQPMNGQDLFEVRWWPEMGWMELSLPVTRERMVALAPNMFERQVIALVTATV